MPAAVRRMTAIFRRELAGYFASPPAYACWIGLPLLSGIATFSIGDFFARGQADLDAFFVCHPWLYLGLAPVLSMRLWAAETESGTIELLLTLPVRPAEAVVGKFLAAWCVAALALATTLPLWVTVNILGTPDNGVIVAGYVASWLMAGALLAVGEAISAASASRTVAFCATAVVLLAMLACGSSTPLGLLPSRVPANLAGAIAAASPIAHFTPLADGDIALPDLVYFLSLTIAGLAAATLIVGLKTAD
jgi:ABC-2 type transport system permease protein